MITGYTPLTYGQTVFLKSIDSPRQISNEQDLEMLADMRNQGLARTSTTLIRRGQESFACPVGALTGAGACFLEYALLELPLSKRFGQFRRDVKKI